jgi:hypothetical protein
MTKSKKSKGATSAEHLRIWAVVTNTPNEATQDALCSGGVNGHAPTFAGHARFDGDSP